MRSLLLLPLLSLSFASFSSIAPAAPLAAPLAAISASDVSEFNIPIVEGAQQWTSLPPQGIGILSWDGAASGSISNELVAVEGGARAFVIRNTAGTGSCLLTIGAPLFEPQLAPNKTYSLKVSYCTSASAAPTLKIKLTGEPGAASFEGGNLVLDSTTDEQQLWKAPLDESPGKWTEFTTQFTVSGAATLSLEFLGGPVGEEHFLAVRSATINESK